MSNSAASSVDDTVNMFTVLGKRSGSPLTDEEMLELESALKKLRKTHPALFSVRPTAPSTAPASAHAPSASRPTTLEPTPTALTTPPVDEAAAAGGGASIDGNGILDRPAARGADPFLSAPPGPAGLQRHHPPLA